MNGPNLMPLVTLGIPGNLAAALILGGFMIFTVAAVRFLLRRRGSLA